jgi:hypothetical protein
MPWPIFLAQVNPNTGTAAALAAPNKTDNDSSQPHSDANLYFFVGVNHAVLGQQDLFNDLFVKGKDGMRLEGVQVISMESFWFGKGSGRAIEDVLQQTAGRVERAKEECAYDLQGYITYYLQTGNSQASRFLETCLSLYPPYKPEGMEKMMLQVLAIAGGKYPEPDSPKHTYEFYAGDLYYRQQQALLDEGFLRHQLMEIRDYNAIQYLRAKVSGKGNPIIEAPHTPAAFKQFLEKRVEREKAYTPLPDDKEQLKAMLGKAIEKGEVLFGLANIYAYLQKIIDDFRKGSKGKVVMAEWGSAHVEKLGLPKFLPKKEQAVSIILTGGAHDTKLLFDQVVREMGMEDKTFIWILPDETREANVVIHLPNPHKETLEYMKQPPNGLYPKGVVTRFRCETCY